MRIMLKCVVFNGGKIWHSFSSQGEDGRHFKTKYWNEQTQEWKLHNEDLHTFTYCTLLVILIRKRLWWMEDGEHRKGTWSSYKLLLRILMGKDHLTVQDIGERKIFKWTLWNKLVHMWTQNFLDRWILTDCLVRTLSQ